MENLKTFFKCSFCQTFDFDDLDGIIEDIKNPIGNIYSLGLIAELYQIIHSKNYKLASKIIDKHGDRIFDLDKTEKILKYLYNKLTDQPAHLERSDFVKDYKVVFCPACCSDPEKVLTYSVIQKATIIEKNIQIYICKPCWLVWLTEDIRAENSQSYKKYMKTLGLKGLWKELKDIDIL